MIRRAASIARLLDLVVEHDREAGAECPWGGRARLYLGTRLGREPVDVDGPETEVVLRNGLPGELHLLAVGQLSKADYLANHGEVGENFAGHVWGAQYSPPFSHVPDHDSADRCLRQRRYPFATDMPTLASGEGEPGGQGRSVG